MNYKIVKGFLMYGLPVVGAGSLIGGTVSGIMQATNPDNKKLSFADEISLSGGPIEINAVTNDKTVALEEIKISSHPTSASHEITWVIVNETTHEAAPQQIYVNYHNQIVIDKGCSPDLDGATFSVQAEFHTNASPDSIKMSQNFLTFKLNLEYVPTDVIGMRWYQMGSTQLVSKMKSNTYAEKAWIAETQDRRGLWSPNNATYELVTNDVVVNQYLKINSDGYLYTTGECPTGQNLIVQIRATANDDPMYTLTSDDIQITILADDTQIDSLKFSNSFNQAVVNYNAQWTSQMPFIASAYDKNGVLIPNPQVDYYVVNNPNYINIDSYGYLHVNSNNIHTYTSSTFQVYARSQVNINTYISQDVTVVVMDTLNNDMYNFDPTTGTIVSLKPKFATWLNTQQGNLTLPDSFDGVNIKALASNLFENISGLKQIVLPHYLEKIGKNCFLNTTNLTSITVNSNIVLEPGSLATGRSTSLVINNQAFADNMSKYLPQEKYANVTLTRDVSTGGWYGCNTSWGVYNSSTRSDNKKSNGGQISTTFSYTHTYINNINDFIAGCLWSTNNKQTVLTISSGGEVVLPTGLQTLIDNTIQYYYSSYKFIYAIQSSDAFKYGGDWAYCDVSYHRYIWNYYATYFTIYRAKKSQIVYSNLSLANEYNAGDATGRDSNEGRSTFGMSVWIRDQNNNIMTAYSKYAKGGHWYDAGGWLSHVDFNTAIENRAVFTW